MPRADTDVIVIGSGHNGLTAAFRLAQAGWRVIVLERAAKIGGAIRTECVTLPGFRHDLFATNLSLFKSSLIGRAHLQELQHAGLQYITCDEAFASAYQNGTTVRIYTDPERTASEFQKCSDFDLAGWSKVLSIYQKVVPQLLPFTNMALPSRDAALQAVRMIARLRTGVFDLRDVIFASARHFVDRFFRTDEAKGVFLPWAFHLDFGPDVPGGAGFAFVSAISAHLNGLILAQGGAGAIVAALERMIASKGGTIHGSTDVSEIILEGGRAIGVKTSSGDVLMASRAIIANVTPPLLFGRLLARAKLPDWARQRASSFRYGPGVFMVHLALSCKVDWIGAEDLWRFNYVHLNCNAEDISRTYAQCMNGLLPDRPMIVVSQPCFADPTRAPTGQSLVRLQVRAVPAQITGDAAGAIHQHDWVAAKEAFADRVVAQFAAHAPGVTQSVLARYVMSPEDFERENPNLIGGDCVSGSHHLDQNYFSRPFRGLRGYRTPIENLYMVGASTWPGGGVNATSGFLVAEELLRKRR